MSLFFVPIVPVSYCGISCVGQKFHLGFPKILQKNADELFFWPIQYYPMLQFHVVFT